MTEHIQLKELPYCTPVKKWLTERYGRETAVKIWRRTRRKYSEYLNELPDYGGHRNGHAQSIYGGLLIFALYPSLPDQPPIAEIQGFVSSLFFGAFEKVGRIFDLNHPACLSMLDLIFRKVGSRDRKDIRKFPDGFVNVNEPFDKEEHASRYHFSQCPNAEFAKKHGLLHVLPLLCNSDYYGISLLHGTLIRCGTCGNSDVCDYCIIGNKNHLADEYEIVTDEKGFMASRKKNENR